MLASRVTERLSINTGGVSVHNDVIKGNMPIPFNIAEATAEHDLVESLQAEVMRLRTLLDNASEAHSRMDVLDELRRERDFSAIIIQTSPTLFAAVDSSGRVIMMNPAALNTLGFTAEEVIGKRWHSRQFISPRDLPHAVAIAKSIVGQRKPVTFEMYLQTKQSDQVFVGWRATPVWDTDGSLDFVFFSGADISAKRLAEENRRKAEELLRENNQILEQRVAERTHELSKLLQASQAVAATLDLDVVLSLVLKQLREVVDYSACYLLAVKDHDESSYDYVSHSASGFPDPGKTWAFDLEKDLHIIPVIRDHIPFILPDTQGHTPEAEAFRQTFKANTGFPPVGIKSWMCLPMVVRERLIGLVILVSAQPHAFDDARASLAMAFASQAATAITNARLYVSEQVRRSEAERRTAVAEALNEIVAALNSNHSLSDTLKLIVQRAVTLLDAQAGAIFQADAKSREYSIAAEHGFGPAALHVTHNDAHAPQSNDVPSNETAKISRIAAIKDHINSLYKSKSQEDIQNFHQWLQAGSLMHLPIIVKGEIYGVLGLYFNEHRQFIADEVTLGTMLARQAALAIENAQLREQAARTAAMAERSRLARELHDSVSQALFGIALGTRTSLELMNGDPHKARDPMTYVLQLADAGMAEMRALIFELRPESLETEGLHAAFKKQAAALVARHKIHVVTNLHGSESDLSFRVKEELYRIGLEAVQNTVKHAHATRVTITLDRLADGSVVLEICDNGTGFEPQSAYPGHFGMISMRERAESVGGQFDISSAPNQGTCVRVQVPILKH
jgi:PAS domain S-box-containing protein